MDNSGRKKLVEKLKLIAKDTPMKQQSPQQEEGARYPFGDDLITFLNHQAPFSGKFGYY